MPQARKSAKRSRITVAPGAGRSISADRAAAIGQAFHDVLRDEIQAQGLTQYRIAKETGISQSLVGRLLAGGGMTADNAAVLLEYLGLEVRRRVER